MVDRENACAYSAHVLGGTRRVCEPSVCAPAFFYNQIEQNDRPSDFQIGLEIGAYLGFESRINFMKDKNKLIVHQLVGRHS
jgi:hypothetical protein